VPLRDVSAFHEWVKSGPGLEVWSAMRTWIAEIGDAPFSAPSVPVPEMSDQPVYEVRYAEPPDAQGVGVLYRQTYATGDVDLLDIG
jgi:hypothetical protein